MGPSLTRVFGIPGTLPYLSPERLDLSQKRALDFRSDLYSLGVVMYEALAGRHPYVAPGMSQDDQLRAIREVVAELPDLVEPGSESLWAVVLRLLEKHPHARYRSCEVVMEELGKLSTEGEQ
jgi:serine/threonine protein kinase